jgi:hypothetical protein
MVRHAQAQRADADLLQHFAGANLAFPFAVPLREHDHREVFFL